MEKRDLTLHISVEERIILSDCVDFVIFCLYTDRLTPKGKNGKYKLIRELEVLSKTIKRVR